MQKRVLVGATSAILAVGALGGFAGARETETVKLGDDFFKPKRVSVESGTKVRFKWTGDNPHNVTTVRGPGRDFASETTDERGVNYTRRFRRAGVYRLICTVHADTMKLRLAVD